MLEIGEIISRMLREEALEEKEKAQGLLSTAADGGSLSLSVRESEKATRLFMQQEAYDKLILFGREIFSGVPEADPELVARAAQEYLVLRGSAKAAILIDPDHLLMVVGERSRRLGQLELKALSSLIENDGSLALSDWATRVYGDNPKAGHRMSAMVSTLRGKLEPDEKNPEHLIYESGKGYSLVGVRLQRKGG